MRRKLSDETNPSDWFYLADDRLHASDLLWKADGLTPSGIETLRQQAGELVLLIQSLLPHQFPPPASLAEQANKSKN